MVLEHLVVSPTPLEPSKHRFHPADFTAYDTDAERVRSLPATRAPNYNDFTKFKIEQPHNLNLAILQVNRQLYNEANYLLTKRNTVSIRIREGHISVLGYMIPQNMDFLQIPKAYRDCSRFHNFQLHVEHEIIYSHQFRWRIRRDVEINTAQIRKLWMLLKDKRQLEVFLGDHLSPKTGEWISRVENKAQVREIIEQSRMTGAYKVVTNRACSPKLGEQYTEWETRWNHVRDTRTALDAGWTTAFVDPFITRIRVSALWDMAIAVNARDKEKYDEACERYNMTLAKRR